MRKRFTEIIKKNKNKSSKIRLKSVIYEDTPIREKRGYRLMILDPT